MKMTMGTAKKIVCGTLAALAALAAPLLASAHEVYVLSSSSIALAEAAPSFSLVQVALRNLGEFAFWGFITALAVFCVFFISTLRTFERALDPLFARVRKYAPFVARVTIGISFLACAYYGATFGPELPFASTFGPLAGAAVWGFAVLGVLALVGLWVRLAAAVALAAFAAATWSHGVYMLTYVNYLGEIIVLLILGAHGLSLDALIAAHRKKESPARPSLFARARSYLAPRSFAILRVLFGVALIYASVYAKVLHNNLALFTVEQYHLDKLLGFEPHFLVLGAAIIELMIGLFFILGVEIRFTALFFLFWLTLSLIFFGEIVWPHLILIGIPIAYLLYGYDGYSLEGYLFRKKKYEPVF